MADRIAQLLAAEAKALAMLDHIEALGLIAPGRSEHEVERDIRQLARAEYGVTRDWHKRIVRAGANTLATYADTPAGRTIGADDMVFLDLGPVFGAEDGGDWEADVGRSYAVGTDPLKHALCAALPEQFDKVTAHFRANADITGAELYAFAVASAEAAGWRFGGAGAGHTVDKFPHRHMASIRPENTEALRSPGPDGAPQHWICEIHLIEPQGRFGGFYERLMVDDSEN